MAGGSCVSRPDGDEVGGSLHLTADEPILGVFAGAGFEVLARTPEEILVGGIPRFSGIRTMVRLPRPDLATFRDFADPGFIKIGLNFRCAHGMLTTETRVSTTDARSRWLFGLYWLFFAAEAASSGASGSGRSVAAPVSSTSGRALLRRESGIPL